VRKALSSEVSVWAWFGTGRIKDRWIGAAGCRRMCCCFGICESLNTWRKEKVRSGKHHGDVIKNETMSNSVTTSKQISAKKDSIFWITRFSLSRFASQSNHREQ
jgi:hypothetical protein